MPPASAYRADPAVILCGGEALIDMIPEPTRSGRDGFVPHCGGAALNTAITLARLGAEVGLLTGLSRDRFGQQLDAALASAGVDRSLIVTSDKPTTLAFVHFENDEAVYSFHDENSAGRMLVPGDLPPIPDHVTCLLLGGISLCHPPVADAFETLAGHAKGRLVMLDPNIRPGFIGDEATYRARLQRMIAHCDIVKLSEADLAWFTGDTTPMQVLLDQILAAGPSLVLVTGGSNGATALHKDGRTMNVATSRVVVSDTVGAGDAFNAGFLAHLAQIGLLSPSAIAGISSGDLTNSLDAGVDVAAQALSRSGGV